MGLFALADAISMSFSLLEATIVFRGTVDGNADAESIFLIHVFVQKQIQVEQFHLIERAGRWHIILF